MRRRRLRQDRSRHAGGVQGGDGRQAGRAAGADDGARVSARRDAEASLRGVSRSASTSSTASDRRRKQSDSRERRRRAALDILVGTHRLLSKDVQFRDLGLLIVDEEQRFGVAHKERIKQMRKKVDVLTMTATPIPRTLNMSLVGIRDMSVIETPPKDRLAIQTNVVKFDAQVIARAIRSEMARGGQVFFVHNRIESIFSMGNLIQRLVPEARGRDRPRPDGRAHPRDARCSTSWRTRPTCCSRRRSSRTASTSRTPTRIIINRADRYGLSQLYQLRGRVGRSDRPAYRVPADSARGIAVAGRAQAARGDQGVQRSRQRLPRRRARSRDPRRRQSPRRRAERPDRRGRLRDVHEAARRNDSRAEGRGSRRRCARDRQPADRLPDRRALRAGHEPAVDDLSAHRGGASRGRADTDHGGDARPLRSAARGRCSTSPTTAASACWPTNSASRASSARAR